MTPFGGIWDTIVCTTCGMALTTPPAESAPCTLTTEWPAPGMPATFPTRGFTSVRPDTRQATNDHEVPLPLTRQITGEISTSSPCAVGGRGGGGQGN